MPSTPETRFIVCGGDHTRLEARSECPNALHDWPLPAGYNDAHTVALSRINQGWGQKRCPDCDLYGWPAPPKTMRGMAVDPVRVRAAVVEP